MAAMTKRCVRSRDVARRHELLITGGDGRGTWAGKDTFATGLRRIEQGDPVLGDMTVSCAERPTSANRKPPGIDSDQSCNQFVQL